MDIKAVLAVAAVVLLSIIGVNYYNSHKTEQRIAERKADIAATQAALPQSSEPKAVEVETVPPTAPVAVQEAPAAEVMADVQVMANQDLSAAQQISESRVDVLATKASLDSIQSRWGDELKVAISTPRIRLSEEVRELQKLRQEVINTKGNACLTTAKDHLAKSMNTMIDGFLDYSSNVHGDSAIDVFQDVAKEANKHMDIYNSMSKSCTADYQ